MARRDAGDPFDAVSDGAPLSVPPGVFRVSGPAERTGSTNARAVRGGFASAFLAAPARQRVSWLTAVVLTALIVVVIPALIGVFGMVRQAQLSAEAATLPSPTLVVVSPEAQAVQNQIDQIDVAYVMSSAAAEPESSAKLGELLATAKAQVAQSDAIGAQSTFDEALTYFIQVYSQRLAALVDTTIDEYPNLEWKTEQRLGELKEAIVANADGHDLQALVASVIELPQVMGQAKTQHLENTESYVPPKPTTPSTPAPAPTPTPAPPGPTTPPTTPGGQFGGGTAPPHA